MKPIEETPDIFADVESDASLEDVKRSLRTVLQEDRKRAANQAQATFATIHKRLMARIESDTAATFVAEAPVPRVRRWPWQTDQPKTFRPVFIKSPLRQGLIGAVTASLLLAALWGAHETGRSNSSHELALQSFVDDFDSGMKSASPFPFEAIGSEAPERAAREAAEWLSERAGTNVEVPSAHDLGIQLIGARHSTLGERPVAQAHYLKDGMRIALYQVRDPRTGLGSLDSVHLNGRTFFTSNRGPYRVVAWRAGEDVIALVSPLAMRESLRLADQLRESEDTK